jgi:hypothetical protein
MKLFTHTRVDGVTISFDGPSTARFVSFDLRGEPTAHSLFERALPDARLGMHRINNGYIIDLSQDIRAIVSLAQRERKLEAFPTEHLERASCAASYLYMRDAVDNIEAELARRDSPFRQHVADCAAFLVRNFAFQESTEEVVRKMTAESIVDNAERLQVLIATSVADEACKLLVGEIIPEPEPELAQESEPVDPAQENDPLPF